MNCLVCGKPWSQNNEYDPSDPRRYRWQNCNNCQSTIRRYASGKIQFRYEWLFKERDWAMLPAGWLLAGYREAVA